VAVVDLDPDQLPQQHLPLRLRHIAQVFLQARPDVLGLNALSGGLEAVTHLIQ
jgi:hypothetical protein